MRIHLWTYVHGLLRRLIKKAAIYSEVYKVEEFAKIFKLSPEPVRTLIRKGEIPAIRIGKQHRIPQEVIDGYFARAISPEERGFGTWKTDRVKSLTYVNKPYRCIKSRLKHAEGRVVIALQAI